MKLTEAKDDYLTNTVTKNRYCTVKDGPSTDEQCQTLIPEEYMSKLEECIGDGNAGVTVSAELATSVDYGNKAGAFVSVRVTCGNDEENIMKAHAIARELAEKFAKEDQSRMEDLLAETRGLSRAPIPSSSRPPAKALLSGGSNATRSVSAKPSFRR